MEVRTLLGEASCLKAPCGTPIVLPNDQILFSDTQNHQLIRTSSTTATAATAAGGGASGWCDGESAAARFDMPSDLSLLLDGNVVVSDTANNRLRVLHIETGEVSTVAGAAEPGYVDEEGCKARFNYMVGVSTLPNGDVVVADVGNHVIRIVNMMTRVVGTLAGSGQPGHQDGHARESSFVHPVGVTALANGDVVVADTGNHLLRLISGVDGTVSTLAGIAGEKGHTDGNVAQATFNGPNNVAVMQNGDLVVADEHNHCIRTVHIEAGTVSTLDATCFKGPCGVSTMPNGDILVVDTGNNALKVVSHAQ